MERLKTMVILALLTALAGSIALAATTRGEAEMRIQARHLDDGRVEFALQQRVDGEWGERILPPSRYFPAEVQHSRWLSSTPMQVPIEVELGSTRTIRSTDSVHTIDLVAGWYRVQAFATSPDGAYSWNECSVELEREGDRRSAAYALGDGDIEYFQIGEYGWLDDTGSYEVRDSGSDNCVSWRVEVTHIE